MHLSEIGNAFLNYRDFLNLFCLAALQSCSWTNSVTDTCHSAVMDDEVMVHLCVLLSLSGSEITKL